MREQDVLTGIADGRGRECEEQDFLTGIADGRGRE